MFSERTFKELEAKACKSVTIGDHNLLDMASLDLVQKGEETLALEVEATGNVLEDAVVLGAMGLETFNLTLEVARLLLVGRGDASVEDGLALGTPEIFVRPLFNAKMPTDILVVIAVASKAGLRW